MGGAGGGAGDGGSGAGPGAAGGTIGGEGGTGPWDPEGTGGGGPGYSVVTELPPDGYQTGELAWAKTQTDAPGTAGSQFFVVTGAEDGQGVGFLNDTSSGSYLYGAFGMITEGLEVSQTIESLSTGDGPPAIPVYIYGVDIAEA